MKASADVIKAVLQNPEAASAIGSGLASAGAKIAGAGAVVGVVGAGTAAYVEYSRKEVEKARIASESDTKISTKAIEALKDAPDAEARKDIIEFAENARGGAGGAGGPSSSPPPGSSSVTSQVQAASDDVKEKSTTAASPQSVDNKQDYLNFFNDKIKSNPKFADYQEVLSELNDDQKIEIVDKILKESSYNSIINNETISIMLGTSCFTSILLFYCYDYIIAYIDKKNIGNSVVIPIALIMTGLVSLFLFNLPLFPENFLLQTWLYFTLLILTVFSWIIVKNTGHNRFFFTDLFEKIKIFIKKKFL
jgi:hypothetical protein